MLGYAPTHSVRQGLREAMPWYLAQASTPAPEPARRVFQPG